MNFLIKKISILSFFLVCCFIGHSQTTVTVVLPAPCSALENDEFKKHDSIDLIIAPNPNDGFFSLGIYSSKELDNLTIEVASVNGNKVYSEGIYCSANRCIKTLDLSALPKAIYFITVSGSSYHKTERISIQ
jgi:hypothetical protein